MRIYPTTSATSTGETSTLSLYELNSLVRARLEQSFADDYWVEAELSEARLASGGHFYVEFVQKDDSDRNLIAKARGTMWARTYSMLAPLFERATGESLRAGIKVRVLVNVVFHELYGYSLNISNIDPSYTLGDMARRRREILSQLEADGIIDDNKTLPLPLLMNRIAVCSSSSAAGYGDFCNQLVNNEYGLHFDITLFPSVMQGEHVEESLIAALEAIAERADDFDCVVIIRGGGATSDLSDFDSYPLAAAVTQMPLPVLVGIGHERDETVLDFVAHTHLKTPTAVAAFIIDHGAEQLAQLDVFQQRIVQTTQLRLQNAELQVPALQQRLLQTARLRLQAGELNLPAIQQRLYQAARQKFLTADMTLQHLATRFAALDPVIQLQRGYSLTFTSDGRLVRSANDVHKGDTICTQLAKGTLQSTITDI